MCQRERFRCPKCHHIHVVPLKDCRFRCKAAEKRRHKQPCSENGASWTTTEIMCGQCSRSLPSKSVPSKSLPSESLPSESLPVEPQMWMKTSSARQAPPIPQHAPSPSSSPISKAAGSNPFSILAGLSEGGAREGPARPPTGPWNSDAPKKLFQPDPEPTEPEDTKPEPLTPEGGTRAKMVFKSPTRK